jgi:predicted  nucleic acid-binding Zn-ribbon protein
MNEEKDSNFFQNISSSNGGINWLTIGLVVLLLGALVYIFWISTQQSDLKKLDKNQKAKIEELLLDSTELSNSVKNLEQSVDSLQSQVSDLEEERNKLKSSVDSVARLLYYAQSNAYASKVQVAKLQKDLKALQDKLATTEKQYKETVERLQEQLDYYKTENDKLTETIEQLKANNEDVTKKLDDNNKAGDNSRALRATISGFTAQDKGGNKAPEATDQNRNVNVIAVDLAFNRVRKLDEKIILRLFEGDKLVETQAIPEDDKDTKKRIYLKAKDPKYTFQPKRKATYKVRSFLLDPTTGTEMSLGEFSFSLR